MNVKDVTSFIKEDAEAIQLFSADAMQDREDSAIYQHTISVLAEHILHQTQILATMPIKEQEE